MRLVSIAFDNNGKIPARFTCDGEGVVPPLTWSEPPAETRSFALICSDADAPSGVWYHWAAFDIPVAWRDLAASGRDRGSPMREAINDFEKPGYGGPCPPRGHGTHHYSFTLYALNIEHLGASANAHCRDIEKMAKEHAVGSAKLTGLYAR